MIRPREKAQCQVEKSYGLACRSPLKGLPVLIRIRSLLQGTRQAGPRKQSRAGRCKSWNIQAPGIAVPALRYPEAPGPGPTALVSETAGTPISR